MGLQNMFKRAKMIGGEVEILTKPGNGTCIQLTIPYQ
jgi:signal transduction histidine kinase